MASATDKILNKYNITGPGEFDPSKFNLDATRKQLLDAGVNLDLLSDQARKLGDERLKLKEDKKEALAFFGLEAGLNILAGKDPNALVNIGAGAGKAIAPLRKELTRLKDQHNALRKEENNLARMQNQFDMGIAKFSQDALSSARKEYNQDKRSYEANRTTIGATLLRESGAGERLAAKLKVQKYTVDKETDARIRAAVSKVKGVNERAAANIVQKTLADLNNNPVYTRTLSELRKAKKQGKADLVKELEKNLQTMRNKAVSRTKTMAEKYASGESFEDSDEDFDYSGYSAEEIK